MSPIMLASTKVSYYPNLLSPEKLLELAGYPVLLLGIVDAVRL